ncbi:helix-turn-helix transcriptional regulator [Bacteroidaceae bacterium HV4-6-C5C]|nr:helix-turn-helix transcriptional regulator [Bacteroidaceae bacterium HV4-6-C5C]
MKRDELLNSKEYWLSKIQIDLFNEVNHFMEEKGLNRTQLAERLGVSKGYVSQIMNGDSDHRLSKLVELSLAIGLVPRLSFEQLDSIQKKDVLDTNDVIAMYEEIENSKKILLNNGYLLGKKNDWKTISFSNHGNEECCA